VIANPEVEANLLAAQSVTSPAGLARLRELLQQVDWRKLIQFAQLHGTTQLLARRLETLNVRPEGEPAAVLSSLVLRNSTRAFIHYRETRRVLNALTSAGITALAYKGVVLSLQLYGRVNVRISSDIDILVAQRDVARALEVLAGLGYSRSGHTTVSDDVRFECSYEIALENAQTRCTVELQWRVAPKFASCGFDSATEALQPAALQSDPNVMTLADEDLILALAHHGLAHCWDSLKWVADIESFLRRTDVNWAAVAARAKKARSTDVLMTAASVAKHLFGVDIPEALGTPSRRAMAAARRLTRFVVAQHRVGDLESFWIQLTLRETLKDRLQFVRYVCTPKPRDLSEKPFWALPRVLQPMLRPLRLLIESHSGNKRMLCDAQKVTEWEGDHEPQRLDRAATPGMRP